MTGTRAVGFACLGGFLASVPLANWMIGHVGTVCVPQGPCLLPVAPGVMAPSGVVTIGFALVLRDVVQRCLGTWLGARRHPGRHRRLRSGSPIRRW